MKKGKEIVKELYNLIEEATDLNDIKIIGVLRNSFNTVNVFDSNSDFFSTILISETHNRFIKKVSFAGEKFNISLKELKSIFGNYEYAYNFRNNYTGFFFSEIESKKILKVYCEKDNNFKKKSDFFFEYTPKGENNNNLTEDMIVFDNIIFDVKL